MSIREQEGFFQAAVYFDVIAGAHREWVLARIAGGDVTLQELADGLAAHGLKVDYRTVWNFVHREGKSFKKNGSWD